MDGKIFRVSSSSSCTRSPLTAVDNRPHSSQPPLASIVAPTTSTVALENRNRHHHGTNQEWKNSVVSQKLGKNPTRNVETEKEGVGGISGSRNSLAWDNAFFTSPGILNYEELSNLSNGIKDELHFLALEQLQKPSSSTPIIDSLGSDIFPLGSPVDGLSEDPYLSIQYAAIHGVKPVRPDTQGVGLENRKEHHRGANQEWKNTVVGQELERNSSKDVETDREGVTGISGSRNSLAWDNAFFTSPGILNCEELSNLNNGIKDGFHFLALEQLQKPSSSKSKIDLLGSDVFPLGSHSDDLSEDPNFQIQHAAVNGVKSTRRDAQGVQKAFPNQAFAKQGTSSAGLERNKRMLPLHHLRASQNGERVTGTRQNKESTRRSLFGSVGKIIPPLPKTNLKNPPRVGRSPQRAPPSVTQRPRARTGSPLERVGSSIPKLLMLGSSRRVEK